MSLKTLAPVCAGCGCLNTPTQHSRFSEGAVIIPCNATVGRSGSVLITFKSPSSVPPYRIENRTKAVMLMLRQQLDQPSASKPPGGAAAGTGGGHIGSPVSGAAATVAAAAAAVRAGAAAPAKKDAPRSVGSNKFGLWWSWPSSQAVRLLVLEPLKQLGRCASTTCSKQPTPVYLALFLCVCVYACAGPPMMLQRAGCGTAWSLAPPCRLPGTTSQPSTWWRWQRQCWHQGGAQQMMASCAAAAATCTPLRSTRCR